MIFAGERRNKLRRALIVVTILGFLAGCSTFQPARPPVPSQNLFIVFFVPGTFGLTPAAQDIVRQAAGTAVDRKASKIEIAIPRDAPGSASLAEGRLTAIQNILSAAHVDSKLLAQAEVSDDAASLPGAADRAEIRLLP